MKPTKQTVYFELDGSEKPNDNIYGVWDKNDFECGAVKKEGYFFTPEQLNEYTANVIKQALETAAGFKANTLEDQYKLKLLQQAFSKYSLSELESRLS